MKLLFAVLVSIVSIGAEGTTNVNNPKEINNYQHLQVLEEKNNNEIFCYAFFLTAEFAATTATCLKGKEPKDVYVTLISEKSKEVFETVQFLFAPNPKKIYNNFALIKLKQPVKNNVTLYEFTYEPIDTALNQSAYAFFAHKSPRDGVIIVEKHEGNTISNDKCSKLLRTRIHKFQICFRSNRTRLFESNSMFRGGCPLFVHHENRLHLVGVNTDRKFVSNEVIEVYLSVNHIFDWTEKIVAPSTGYNDHGNLMSY